MTDLVAPPVAVTFDYWNTLCREREPGTLDGYRAAAIDAVLSAAGVDLPTERLAAATEQSRRAYEAAWIRNRQFGPDDGAGVLLAELGDVVDPGSPLAAEVTAAFGAVPEPAAGAIPLLPGVAAVLEALHVAGIRLGIICDVGFTGSPLLRANLEHHGVLGRFAHWSFSDEVGVYKPDRQIFEHALAGLGDPDPGQTWHVGDRRRTDIAGAQVMGMRAARITAVFDDADPAQGPSGDAVVAGWDELPAVFGVG